MRRDKALRSTFPILIRGNEGKEINPFGLAISPNELDRNAVISLVEMVDSPAIATCSAEPHSASAIANAANSIFGKRD